MRFLDDESLKERLAGFGQQGASGVVILDGKTLFDNVAIGTRLVGQCLEERYGGSL